MKLFQCLVLLAIPAWNCAAQFLHYRSEFADEILDSRDFDDEHYGLFDTRDILDALFDLELEQAISKRAAKRPLKVSPALLKQLSTCKAKRGKRSLPEADMRWQKRSPRVYDPLFNGRATVVNMGSDGFRAFSNGEEQSIGADGLCGCTVIAISSPHGAIVAHINPGGNIDGQLLAVRQRYQTNRNALAGATLQMIYPAKLEASLQQAAEAVSEYIAGELAVLGLSTKTAHYNPMEPQSEPDIGHRGTVIIVNDGRGSVKTYVNGKIV